MSQQTEINGNRFSWTSLEMRLGGIAFPGAPFQSVNYRYTKKGTKVFGNGVLPVGKTRGQLDVTGEFEILRSEWDAMVAFFMAQLPDPLQSGFLDYDFTVVVSYSENDGADVVTDTLFGVRIEDGDHSNTQGTDPTKVRMTFVAMNISLNGVFPAGESVSGPALGIAATVGF